jgi:Flp pilus assembly pilin Flp
MGILKEENAQTSAEFILLLGGIIVIVMIALVSYNRYLGGLGNEINNTDVKNVNNQLQGLTNKFNKT